MVFSESEVFEFISDQDVKFIRLAFIDVYGNQKNISIMPSQLKKAINEGVLIDASMIKGFESAEGEDLFLYPELDTFSLLPWRPQRGRVIRFFCHICYQDKRPFELDSRTILKNAVSYAKKKGVTFRFGCRSEFYLFKKDENGDNTKIPLDNAGYLDIAPKDLGENVRRDICLNLEEMHIIPIASHHEEGPGQNEIEFEDGDPMSAADNFTTVKSVVKTIAENNGLCATFDPKPLDNQPGNGCHITLMANNDIKNIAAGIMKNIEGMTLICNPIEESFDRLGNGRAPKYVNWSHDNCGALIRIPRDNGHMELRSPDAIANTYLVYTLLIYAGLEGIDERLEITQPKLELPKNKMEAYKCAKNSEFVNKYLSKYIIDLYNEYKS